MRKLAVIPLVFLLAQCRASSPGTAPRISSHRGGYTHVINVSSYDPKERQRNGRGFSEHDVSALRANGANALIARAGKGGTLDPKCAAFVASADRAGMLPGVYYRLQNHVDAAAQADQFVNRAQQIARSRSWNAPALLLCGDYDSHSRLSDILRFMDRVHQRTGVIPVTYLENSAHLKRLLASASPEAKAKLRRSPYWVALYSHDNGAGDPRDLVGQYSVWSDWSLWQYGGVEWNRGRSRAKVYCHGRYQFSPYFGDMDRPLERNVFKGDSAALQAFWTRHGLPLR